MFARSNLFVKEQTPMALAAGYKGKAMMAYIAIKWAEQKAGVSSLPSLLMLTDESGSSVSTDSTFEKLVDSLKKAHKSSLKKLLKVFELDVDGDKDEVCRRLAAFLFNRA